MIKLLEDSRSQLLSKSKSKPKGKQRFDRRTKSRVATSVRQYNSIDMNLLFRYDTLSVNLTVNGETDVYTVRIKFKGFLENLHKEIKNSEEEVNLRYITRALINSFNRDDVYIYCSCKDFHYRFNYWVTKDGLNSGEGEDRPSDITNPNNELGIGCKHILLILSNTNWLIKVASVINNYIKYMEKHYQKLYADIIYPAIYERDYEEHVQLDLFDKTDLATDSDTDELDISNEFGKKRTQFQKGNEQGIRFAKSNNSPDQYKLVDDEESSDEIEED